MSRLMLWYSLEKFCKDASNEHHQHMGLLARKSVFRVSDQAMLKPAFSATEASWNIEILPVAKLTWMKVFRIIPEFRILRLTFHRKSA